MDKFEYQIWLKAIPLNNKDRKKQKSDVLFSSNFGRKFLFKLFDQIKPEVKILPKDTEVNSIDIIFKALADQELSTDELIEAAINNYLKNLRNIDPLIEKINNILILLRKKKIKFWEAILDGYLKDKEKNNREIKNLWISRRVNLGD